MNHVLTRRILWHSSTRSHIHSFKVVAVMKTTQTRGNQTNNSKTMDNGQPPLDTSSPHPPGHYRVQLAKVQMPSDLYPRLMHLYPHLFPPAVCRASAFLPSTGGTGPGPEFVVHYADSANRLEASCDANNANAAAFDRTIVAIHGTPGHFSNFDRLLRHYSGTRTRVIAPNLPDFGTHTRRHSGGGIPFQHTTPEKVAFLAAFLRGLNLHRIDCLLSHSWGFQTITGLFEESNNHNNEFDIRSLAFFSPQPGWDLTEDRRREIARWLSFRSEPWYRLLALCRAHKLPVGPFTMRFQDIDQFLWLCTAMQDHHTPVDAHRRLEKLRTANSHSAGVPIVVQYGTKETIVRPVSVRALYRSLGLCPDTGEVVRLQGDDHSPPGESHPMIRHDARIKGYLLEGGGHFAYAKYHHWSVAMIEQLLEYAKNLSNNNR